MGGYRPGACDIPDELVVTSSRPAVVGTRPAAHAVYRPRAEKDAVRFALRLAQHHQGAASVLEIKTMKMRRLRSSRPEDQQGRTGLLSNFGMRLDRKATQAVVDAALDAGIAPDADIAGLRTRNLETSTRRSTNAEGRYHLATKFWR